MAVCAVFVVVYGPDCGRGFITDDFGWIAHGRLDGLGSVGRILVTAQGFYRPLVSLSFGLDEQLFGLNATGFGWTNLALALACGGLVSTLGRQLGLAAGPAMVASTIWLFNFHGIGMSVLWVSGRTSLLLSLFSGGSDPTERRPSASSAASGCSWGSASRSSSRSARASTPCSPASASPWWRPPSLVTSPPN